MTLDSLQPDDRSDLERTVDAERLASALLDDVPTIEVPRSRDDSIRMEAHALLAAPAAAAPLKMSTGRRWLAVAACLGLIAIGIQAIRFGTSPIVPPVNTAAPLAPLARGDVNGDGTTDILDAMRLDALLAIDDSALPDAARADMNRDGFINAADVDAIAQAVVALHVVADPPEAG